MAREADERIVVDRIRMGACYFAPDVFAGPERENADLMRCATTVYIYMCPPAVILYSLFRHDDVKSGSSEQTTRAGLPFSVLLWTNDQSSDIVPTPPQS